MRPDLDLQPDPAAGIARSAVRAAVVSTALALAFAVAGVAFALASGRRYELVLWASSGVLVFTIVFPLLVVEERARSWPGLLVGSTLAAQVGLLLAFAQGIYVMASYEQGSHAEGLKEVPRVLRNGLRHPGRTFGASLVVVAPFTLTAAARRRQVRLVGQVGAGGVGAGIAVIAGELLHVTRGLVSAAEKGYPFAMLIVGLGLPLLLAASDRAAGRFLRIEDGP